MLQQVLVPACPHEGYTACRGGRTDLGGFLRALIHRDLHRRIENQGARDRPAVSPGGGTVLFHHDCERRLRGPTCPAESAAGTRAEARLVGSRCGKKSINTW